MKGNVNMVEEARKLQNAYNREWRAKNKDKVKQYNAAYWERRVAKIAAEREKGSTK